MSYSKRPPPLRAPSSKKSRHPAVLLIQIALGGGAGVLLALLILRFLVGGPSEKGGPKENNLARAPRAEDSKPAAAPKAAPANASAPVKRARNDWKPDSAARSRTAPNVDPSSQPTLSPRPADKPASDRSPPAAPVLRLPITKEALTEHFAKLKIPPAARFWWCEGGFFELVDGVKLKFISRGGEQALYLPVIAATDHLELENESADRRIRLFLDRAESASPPFDVYKTEHEKGKWIVPVDQTGVDWFAKAIADLQVASRKSRAAAADYMRNLFKLAEQKNLAGKLKDAPIGFNLDTEKANFERTQLIPLVAPLLPMAAEYAQECRKMHKNEAAIYGRIANRLTRQREEPARDFLAFHQWLHARPWRLAEISWADPETKQEMRYRLLSNGAVNDFTSSETWKLDADILSVDIGPRRLRFKINQTGEEFCTVGQSPEIKGKFLR